MKTAPSVALVDYNTSGMGTRCHNCNLQYDLYRQQRWRQVAQMANHRLKNLQSSELASSKTSRVRHAVPAAAGCVLVDEVSFLTRCPMVHYSTGLFIRSTFSRKRGSDFSRLRNVANKIGSAAGATLNPTRWLRHSPSYMLETQQETQAKA